MDAYPFSMTAPAQQHRPTPPLPLFKPAVGHVHPATYQPGGATWQLAGPPALQLAGTRHPYPGQAGGSHATGAMRHACLLLQELDIRQGWADYSGLDLRRAP